MTQNQEYLEKYQEYKGYVAAIVNYYIKDVNLQKDAFQEIWLNVYHAYSDFGGKSKFSTWLYSISKFTCCNLIRKNRHSRFENTSIEGNRIDVAEKKDPISGLDQKECLREAMSELKEEERQMIIMKYSMKYTFQEIADEFGIKVTMVRGRLDYAREKIRKKLVHLLD